MVALHGVVHDVRGELVIHTIVTGPSEYVV